MTETGRVGELPDALGPPPPTGRLGLAVAAALLAAAVLGGLVWGYSRVRLGRIGVEASWLTRGLEGPRQGGVVGASGAEDLYYHVRLTGVPLGRSLEVECEWFDPRGATVRLNRYETRVVDHDPWPTHCACPLGGAAPGPWRVLMSVEGRPVSETAFDVEGS